MCRKLIVVLFFYITIIVISMVFVKEQFCVPIKAYNDFIDNKNDCNFQSDVMNTSIFFNNPGYVQNIITNIRDIPKKRKSEPDEWVYENEFVMNGGAIGNNIKGYDTRYPYSNSYFPTKIRISDKCKPLKRGIEDDDIRMGLGIIQAENRFIR